MGLKMAVFRSLTGMLKVFKKERYCKPCFLINRGWAVKNREISSLSLARVYLLFCHMKYLRATGSILLVMGLIIRLFVPSQSANGATLAAVGGLLMVAAIIAAPGNAREGQSNR
jgi:hypothetical protein